MYGIAFFIQYVGFKREKMIKTSWKYGTQTTKELRLDALKLPQR